MNTSRTNESFSLPFATAIAPSFPGVFRSDAKDSPNVTKGPPGLKEPDGQFEIIRELGRGASGVVYLARQVALNRQVALKVTYNVGKEAQTMANLEHPNVVQVFSETLSRDGQLRLICMQYVAGITLADLVDRLRGCGPGELNGLSIIQLIAEATHSEIPEGVDVELLEKQSYVETVCRLGLDMARALEHSHRQTVIHRDIKPANVLINRMGQPLLADFSLSLESVGGDSAETSMFGGTLAYMAPEHLDALRPASAVGHDVVDERSDIYSLGLVLHELLSLEHQPLADTSLPLDETCRQLGEQRRNAQFSLKGEQGRIGLALQWTLRQCLQPNPDARFQRAGELVASLEGCKTLADIIKNLPAKNYWTKALETSPAFSLTSIGFVPNLTGSAIGIAYAFASPRTANTSDAGNAMFGRWCTGSLITSIVIGLIFVTLYSRWYPRKYDELSQAGDIGTLRRSLRRLGRYGTLLVFVLWLPSLFVTPYIVYHHQKVFSADVFVEILICNVIVISIVMSLTYLLGAFVAFRACYPFLWDDVRDLRRTAANELRGVPQRLRLLHWIVGAVPLAGAVCVILAGSENFPASGVFSFRILGIGLIGGGLIGLAAVGTLRSWTERTIGLFTGENAG